MSSFDHIDVGSLTVRGVRAGDDFTLTGARNETFARAASNCGQRIAAIGDSNTIGNSVAGTATTGAVRGDKDWLAWACLLSGGKLQYARNAGVPANSTAQMLARFDADVTPYAPNVVVINGGTNDAINSVPLATHAANIKAMVGKTLAIGARPVLKTTLPINSTGVARQLVETYGIWQKLYAAQQGIALLDSYGLVIDPTTGRALPEYVYDNLHLSAAGAKVVGQALTDLLAHGSPLWTPPLACHQLVDSRNLFPGGLFLVDTNADGVADGFSKTAVGTGSIITGDTAIKGNWQRLTDTSLTNAFITTSPNNTTGYSIGDRIGFGGRVTIVNGTSTATSRAFLQMTAGANGIKPLYDWSLDVTNVPIWGEEVVFSDTVSLSLILSRLPTVQGTGYIQLAQFTAYNLTTLGVAAALA